MKNYLFSATLLATGTWFMLNGPEKVVGPVEPITWSESENNLKIQQAQLRRVHLSDLLESPRIRPVSRDVPISSYFGFRFHPVYNKKKMHLGVDFPAPVGSPVRATAGGVIMEAITRSDSSNYGKHIIIGHDDVHITLYAHLSKIYVEKGEEVHIGDTIGLVGNTGVSTNPHLHYEVMKYGEYKNPLDYFE